jgi:hypothetical protein
VIDFSGGSLAVESVDLKNLLSVSDNDKSKNDSGTGLVVDVVGGQDRSMNFSLNSNSSSRSQNVIENLLGSVSKESSGKLDLSSSSDVDHNLRFSVASNNVPISHRAELSSIDIDRPRSSRRVGASDGESRPLDVDRGRLRNGSESGRESGEVSLSVIESGIDISGSSSSSGSEFGGSRQRSSDEHVLAISREGVAISSGEDGSIEENSVVSNNERIIERIVPSGDSSSSKLMSKRVLSIRKVEVVADSGSSFDVSRSGIERIERDNVEVISEVEGGSRYSHEGPSDRVVEVGHHNFTDISISSESNSENKSEDGSDSHHR